MNKIAVVAMVKNEEDIIESFTRHACSFADLLLVANHQSSDRTRKILELLQSENFPIQIFELENQAYDHSKVMTNLTRQAIDVGADIILPMDADEFLVQSNGNSKSLRQALQNLDPNRCYTMPWVYFELIEPEIDADRFILARKFLREKEIDNGPKTCAGAESVKKYNLTIMKGGHHVISAKSVDNLEIPIGSGIFNAHFPKRSAGQILSKTMCGWIGHLLRFGQYGRFSFDWFDTAREYIDENISPEYHLKNPIETRELDGFRFECQNRYTIGNIDPLKNVYQLATKLAFENFRNEILKNRELVRIYVLFDGDVEATIDSLKSAIDQTYPFRKIFIVAAQNRNLDKLFDSAGRLNLTEEIGLINPDDPVITSSGGGFSQFVTAGDRLHPDKIFRSIEAIYSDAFKRFASVCMEYVEDRGYMPDRISHPLVCPGDVLQIHKSWITELDCCFSAGLSGFLFRQEILNGNLNFIRWICSPRIDAVQMEFLIPIFDQVKYCVVMKDELVKKSRAWTIEDRTEFEKILDEFLHQ